MSVGGAVESLNGFISHVNSKLPCTREPSQGTARSAENNSLIGMPGD